MNIEKELRDIEFHNRENSVTHTSYEKELAFFGYVKSGNIEMAMQYMTPFTHQGMGKLSEDPVRSLKYHLVITIALMTRYCIEGGMEKEEAFNLSDIYIRKVDTCENSEEINLLQIELINDYAQRMQLVHKTTLYPKPITQALEYIYNNLHSKITLEDLARHVNLSPSHLSKLFHMELGTTISKYVTEKRINAAKNMLRYSDYTCAEISNYLCFSSESYFIQMFHKHTGMTPRSYRKEFFFKQNG